MYVCITKVHNLLIDAKGYMTSHLLITYVVLVAITTYSPGPAVFFILTNSTLYGWRKALYAALGNISGLLCLGIISFTGLGTVLTASQSIFDIIKYAGAAYLIYMGVKMLMDKNSNFSSDNIGSGALTISSRKLYFKAMTVALSNPKAIVFLTALFPQFINTSNSLLPQFVVLLGILILFSFTALMTYAVLAHQAKGWITKPSRAGYVTKTGGSVFIFFGIILALSGRKS